MLRQFSLTNIKILSVDLDDKPKLLLRNIPAQHLYLRMATGTRAIKEQLLKFRQAELSHIFLACNSSSAEEFIHLVSIATSHSLYVLSIGDLLSSTSKAESINVFHTDPVFSRKNVNIVCLSDFVQFC